MGQGLVVRLATAADAEAVARLADELNQGQGDPVGHFTPEIVRRESGNDPPEFRIVLALQDGEPVGYALFHPSFSTEWGQRGFYLSDLLVTAAARRRGVGRELMAAVARLAAAEGRTFLWWCSKPWNAGAHAFYAGLGAIEEEVRAHALFGDALADLAAAGPEPRDDPGRGPV